MCSSLFLSLKVRADLNLIGICAYESVTDLAQFTGPIPFGREFN
jgi:hypothetical protein